MSTLRISTSDISDQSLKSVYLISINSSGVKTHEINEYLTIGRDEINNLVLADPFVSSRHARIDKRDKGYVIKDLRSQNGVFVNGISVIEAILSEGDKIRIGEREFMFTQQLTPMYSDDRLNSNNQKWDQQLKSLPLFARTDLPALLLGSSGSGKEVVAHLIHEHSKRSKSPFLSVNCSALNENLIESELFGHIKGSFTGATQDRKGAFEAVRNGTLFLDEIGDLPLTLQPKLLRAIENKEIRPVGSDRTIKTDVRIIAATHKDLNQLVAEGKFRRDLFFRLHVIRITLPDLIDRIEDFEKILIGFAKEMGVRFSYEAIAVLKKHSWPGNIRELRNVVARASALFPTQAIHVEEAKQILDPDKYVGPSTHILSAIPLIDADSHRRVHTPVIKTLEKELIIAKLKDNWGNQRRTAFQLGIPKSTLHDKLKSYDIDPLVYKNKEGRLKA